MRIGEIVGTVTLSRAHRSLDGATFRVAVPLTLDNLSGRGDALAEPLVLFDELGAGLGSRVAFSEGGEAAQPFQPELKPIDAYNAAILDSIHISGR